MTLGGGDTLKEIRNDELKIRPQSQIIDPKIVENQLFFVEK
jgi:hypothetical protein